MSTDTVTGVRPQLWRWSPVFTAGETAQAPEIGVTHQRPRAEISSDDSGPGNHARNPVSTTTLTESPASFGEKPALYFTKPQLAHANRIYKRWQRLPVAYQDKLKAFLASQDPERLAGTIKALELFESGQITVNHANATPLPITELQRRTGWPDDSWQMRLLEAVDGAGRFRRDGEITASEMVTGLRNPEDPEFVSTSALERLADFIGGDDEDESGQLLDAIQKQWEKSFVDSLDSSGDGQIDIEELRELASTQHDRLAIQNLTVLFHEIAQQTGEPDPFRIGGLDRKHLGIVRSSYAGAFDRKRLVATVIAQVVTAGDINQKEKVERRNSFHADQELLLDRWQVEPEDYKHSGYDRGHLASSADAANKENMLASFSMLNMSPQTPQMNRFSWRYLERGIREVIADTGGRAVVYTGNLYVDEKGEPLPENQVKKIGKEGREIHVPTHCFKAILFELPNGEVTAVAYRVANLHDLPTDTESVKQLLWNSRISIADLEHQAGVTLFDEMLPPHIKAKLAADTEATVPLHDEELEAAQYLWEQPNPVTSWIGAPAYRVDAELEALDRLVQAYAQLAREAETPGSSQATNAKATDLLRELTARLGSIETLS